MQMILFLSAKTSNDMKDTHMRLVNVSGVYTTQLAHVYSQGSHLKYRHSSLDALIRNLFFSVINNFTHSLQVGFFFFCYSGIMLHRFFFFFCLID